MESEIGKNSGLPFLKLRKLIEEKWPGAFCFGTDGSGGVFSTGIETFDSIFPRKGISYGQIVEITGGVSSGKTSFLFRMLGSLTKRDHVVYLDFSRSFFPSAAESSGMDISQVLVERSSEPGRGLRVAELILKHKLARCIVFDLVGTNRALPYTMMHRLRQETLRASAIIFFLTEGHSRIIPAAMVSLRLEVRRIDRLRFEVVVTKSRISGGQSRFELALI